MFKNRGIKLIHPKPYEKVGLSFVLSGWVSKSWLESRFGKNYQINLHFLNARGSAFLGASFTVKPSNSWTQRFLGRVPFYQVVVLSESNAHFTQKSQGRIAVKLSGHNDGQEIIIPIIVEKLEPESGADSKTIELHRTIPERISQYKVDLEKWGAELEELRKKREDYFQQSLAEDKDAGGIEIQDRGLLVGIFNIFDFFGRFILPNGSSE